MYDYQKQLAEKQKEISSIEKQLAAYQGDTSEEGASKRQQLQNDLNDAKQDLAETQYERSIADQKKLLDDLYEQYEEVLNMRLDNIDVLVSDVITNVNSEAGAIRDTLEAKADSVGYTMTESMNTIWNSANQVITNYGTNFLSSITGVQNAINDLTNLIKQAVDASNKKQVLVLLVQNHHLLLLLQNLQHLHQLRNLQQHQVAMVFRMLAMRLRLTVVHIIIVQMGYLLLEHRCMDRQYTLLKSTTHLGRKRNIIFLRIKMQHILLDGLI